MDYSTGLTQLRRQFRASAEFGICLTKSAIKENIESEELGENFSKFVQNVGELDIETAILEQTLENLAESYKQSDEDVPTDPAYNKAFNQAAKQFKNETGHPYFKEANKIINELLNKENEEDDADSTELQVQQVQHSRKDPISKKDIVKPVINVECGHVYDHDSILEFAGKKRSIPCVIQGCSKNIITKNLAEYPEFWDNLKQQD